MTTDQDPTLPGTDCAPLPLSATCELTVTGPAGWRRCPDAGTPVHIAGGMRVLCPTHARQLPGLIAAGLLERLRFTTPPTPSREGP
jgi:hypothetical protein